ncbi:MAG: cytochrome C [Gammaproteobacteria bacterium]|nr:cytochrome C [Gammaproteobacteria bacterium]
MTFRKPMLAALAAAAMVVTVTESAETASPEMSAQLVRGKYLVQVAGCNDCHTAGYAPSAGKVDESQWLLGERVGYRGPWGTTYATNLRLAVQDMTAEQFMVRARSPPRPPMPWFNLVAMRDGDLKAIFAYLQHLGPAGEPAPAYVPPDQTPTGPFVQFPAPPPGAKP